MNILKTIIQVAVVVAVLGAFGIVLAFTKAYLNWRESKKNPQEVRHERAHLWPEHEDEA